MTRYEAFIDKSWREEGLAHLLVARIRESSVEIGVFLADLWCLGVKDAYLIDDATEAELTDILTSHIPEAHRERIHPACAKKLVETAVAYAEKLGFNPHRDFRKARRVLSGLNSADCPEEFTGGRDGRPCYVEGPDDSEERTEKILALLDAKFGPDGYDFEPHLGSGDPDDPLNPDPACDLLYDFIKAHPAPAFATYSELSGLTCSLHVCPKLVMLTRTLELFIHPGHPAWPSANAANQISGAYALFWNHVGGLFAAMAENPDYYLIDLHDDDEELPLNLRLSLWCRGFMHSFELWPEAWADALQRPQLKPLFDLLRTWADSGETSTADDGETQITQTVLTLYQALEAERKAPGATA